MSIPFVELFHPSKEVSIFVLNFLSSRKTLIHLVFTEEHFFSCYVRSLSLPYWVLYRDFTLLQLEGCLSQFEQSELLKGSRRSVPENSY